MEVADNGRVLALGRGRQRALLGLLLLRANEVVAQDRARRRAVGRVAAADGADRAARPRLAAAGAARRRARRDAAARLRAPGRATTSSTCTASSGCSDRSATTEALALWRGPPLSDLAFESFAQGEIARLEELRLAALERRFERDLADGRHVELVGQLAAALARAPAARAVHGPADARAVSRRAARPTRSRPSSDARSRLVEELGLEPGEELKALQRRILEHDPALDLARPARRRTSLPASPSSFVGRRRELEHLRGCSTGPARACSRSPARAAPERRGSRSRSPARLAGDFADGACFVPLAAVGDARARRARDRPGTRTAARAAGQSIADALKAFVRERELLLVLDNFEHLLDAAPIVARAAGGRAGADGPRDEPDAPQPLRRERVRRAAAGAARPPGRRELDALRRSRQSAVRRAGSRGADRLRAHGRQRRRDRRDLRAPRRAAAGDRAGRGADPHARPRRDAGPARAAARAADRRPARRARPSAHAAGHARGGATTCSRREQRLFARLGVFSRRVVRARPPATSAAARSRASASLAEQSLIRAERRHGSRCSRRSASSRWSELAAERGGARDPPPRTRAGASAVAEEAGPNAGGSARAAWLARLGARAREPARRARLGRVRGRRRRDRTADSRRRCCRSGRPTPSTRRAGGLSRRSLSRSNEPTVGRARALAVVGWIAGSRGTSSGASRPVARAWRCSGRPTTGTAPICLNLLGTMARYRRPARGGAPTLRRGAGARRRARPLVPDRARLGERRHALRDRRPRSGGRTTPTSARSRSRSAGGDRLDDSDVRAQPRARRTARGRRGARDRAQRRGAPGPSCGSTTRWGVAVCLDGFACLAADRGDFFGAARLYGAEEAVRRRAGVAPWRTIRVRARRRRAAASAALGEVAWADARARARRSPTRRRSRSRSPRPRR